MVRCPRSVAPAAGDASSAPIAHSKYPETACSTQRTVLIVDDDPDFRLALGEALRSEGHHVIEARSGEAALGVLNHIAIRNEGGCSTFSSGSFPSYA